MKIRECICGIGTECTGVSAAFQVLKDPRAGYTSLPRYIEDECRSRMFADNNRLREATLRHILPPDQDPESFDDSHDKKYIANHHFHPKIVEHSTQDEGNTDKCNIPMFMSAEDNENLHIGLTDEERVLDENGKPTGGYYIVPNYPFLKAKMDLNNAVKRLRLAKQIVQETRQFEELDLLQEFEMAISRRRTRPIGVVVIPSCEETTGDSTLTQEHIVKKTADDNGKLDDSKETADETVDLSTVEEEDDVMNESDVRDREQKSQDELLLRWYISRMSFTLPNEGSYSFQYRDFDIVMEVPEAGIGSGVLMSTVVGLTCAGDDPEAHTVDCMEKALLANRKRNEKTGSTAYLGTRDNKIILYLYSLAPRNPPDFVEFEQSILEFLDIAQEIRSQTPGSMQPKTHPSQKQSQNVALNMHFHLMDLALDTKDSYYFQYGDFDVLMEAPKAGDESGVLMSTTVGRMNDCSDPEDQRVDFVIRALEANRMLNEKRGSTAYVGTKDDGIVLYQFSLAPRYPPDYVEFEQSMHEFLEVAAELQAQMGHKIRHEST